MIEIRKNTNRTVYTFYTTLNNCETNTRTDVRFNSM